MYENYGCVFVRAAHQVGPGKHRVVPRARAQQRRVPVGHIRQLGDAKRIPDRRTDEVQERVQVQNYLRGAANRHGAVAGLRERRVGSHESHATLRPHTDIASGNRVKAYCLRTDGKERTTFGITFCREVVPRTISRLKRFLESVYVL